MVIFGLDLGMVFDLNGRLVEYRECGMFRKHTNVGQIATSPA